MKRYVLDNGTVRAMTDEEIQLVSLNSQKPSIIAEAQDQLNRELVQFCGVLLPTLQSRIQDSQAALLYLADPDEQANKDALQPLAQIWNMTLDETAQE